MAMMEILVKVSIGPVFSTVREKIRKGEKYDGGWKDGVKHGMGIRMMEALLQQ